MSHAIVGDNEVKAGMPWHCLPVTVVRMMHQGLHPLLHQTYRVDPSCTTPVIIERLVVHRLVSPTLDQPVWAVLKGRAQGP